MTSHFGLLAFDSGGTIWTIVGVLFIIALLMYILGRRG
jgi:hypothetical protein